MNIIEAAKAMSAGKRTMIDEDGSGFGKSFSLGLRDKTINSYIVYDDNSEFQPMLNELLSEKWTVLDE